MTKVSPIASILTQTKATTKHNGNVCTFYTKEGMFIGTQLKQEQDGISTYIRYIYDNSLKQLYRECIVIGQQCAYFKDKKSPIGICLVPTKSCIITQTVDFLKNKIKTVEKEVTLNNKIEPIAADEDINLGIYETYRPYLFKTKIIENTDKDIIKPMKIKHETNN